MQTHLSEGRQTIRITVKGKVQGVFYRQTAKEKAGELEIGGNIKNAPDGDVHIIATGTKEKLREFTNWCRSGPPKAIVDEVYSEEIPLQPFDAFKIVRY
jgi:acylphosphatase